MTEGTQTPFIKKFRDHPPRDYFGEFAEELAKLHSEDDSEGVRDIYYTYIVSTGRAMPDSTYSSVENLTRINMLRAARLADAGLGRGYEKGGIITFLGIGLSEGPICEFYRKAIGFPRGKEKTQ